MELKERWPNAINLYRKVDFIALQRNETEFVFYVELKHGMERYSESISHPLCSKYKNPNTFGRHKTLTMK